MRQRLVKKALAIVLSMLTYSALQCSPQLIPTAQSAPSFMTPEAPYPHSRTLGGRQIIAAGTSSITGTMQVELHQYWNGEFHLVSLKNGESLGNTRLKTAVKCTGGRQQYYFFTRVAGGYSNGYYSDIKDSRIVQLAC